MMDASVNEMPSLSLSESGGVVKIGDQPVQWERIQVDANTWHVLLQGKGYRVLVHSVDRQEKEVLLTVNGKKAKVKLTTEMDRLLARLGMNAAAGKRAAHLKAPMPGMIYSIRVAEGDAVKKGDAVLILEAMKMENVIKAPGDGTIKQIHVQKGMSVDKGQLLITFA